MINLRWLNNIGENDPFQRLKTTSLIKKKKIIVTDFHEDVQIVWKNRKNKSKICVRRLNVLIFIYKNCNSYNM